MLNTIEYHSVLCLNQNIALCCSYIAHKCVYNTYYRMCCKDFFIVISPINLDKILVELFHNSLITTKYYINIILIGQVRSLIDNFYIGWNNKQLQLFCDKNSEIILFSLII